MTSVLYWNNIPSPYVVGRFNAVAERGNISLIAWFNQEREHDRSWAVRPNEWAFQFDYVGTSVVKTSDLRSRLQIARPNLFVSLYHTPAFILGSMEAKLLGYRVAYRVLPTFESWQPRRRSRELMKHALFRSIDGVKVSGTEGAEYAMRYGIAPHRVHQVTQSIDVAHYQKAQFISSDERQSLRSKLGLAGHTFIYVGRLWSGKGIDALLDAYEIVKAECPDVSLLLVGDGQDAERYRARSRSIGKVVVTGFVQADELPQLYGIADSMVFPTLGDPNGLVVEEAMAAGLPVVSSEAAGNIRHRLPDGVAGLIVPPDNPSHLANAMLKLVRDPKLAVSMGQAGSELVETRDHRKYAEDFEVFVDRVLSSPPVRAPFSHLVHWASRPLLKFLPS